MSKKKEKVVLTPDQVKVIKLHRKKYLRDAGFEYQTLYRELKWHLATYLRHSPSFVKTVEFANGNRYDPAAPLDQALIMVAKKIRSSMHRYHKAYIQYEKTGFIINDPLLNGSYFELYEQTCKTATTLQNINETLHDLIYLDKQEFTLALLSLVYELGGQMQAIETITMRPAAEKSKATVTARRKLGEDSKLFPEEHKTWLIKRARQLDATRMNREQLFEALARELHNVNPELRLLSWRCMQDHLLKYLPVRRKTKRHQKKRQLD